MTRKHFNMIAEIIASVENIEVRKQLAGDFSRKLAQENANFNRDRFNSACRV